MQGNGDFKKESLLSESKRIMNTRTIGGEKEAKACEYLVQNGYTILEHNFQCKSGEIDIIAYDGDYLVFIEVKYRSSTRLGFPHEAVDVRKIKKIVNTARYYMFLNKYSEFTACRFDVLVILNQTIEIIQNAFEAT